MLISDRESPAESTAPLAAAERAAAASFSTWVSLAVNVVLTTVQILIGLWSHSQALVADGVHSLSDLLSDFVVLLANRHSGKAPDEDHPYGHHRFETAASLALGGLLIAVGLGMLWAAVLKLEAPETIAPVHGVALAVAVLALVAKEGLFRYMLAVAQRVKSSLLVANAWHARSDAASSAVVALGVLGNLAGYPLLDPLAAVVVGLMVARMGWRFGWDALNDLMDRAADETEVAQIRATLEATPGVKGVHDLRTRKMADQIGVDVHLEVEATLTVEEGHSIAVDAHQRVLAQHPVLTLTIHVDPWHRPDADHAASPTH